MSAAVRKIASSLLGFFAIAQERRDQRDAGGPIRQAEERCGLSRPGRDSRRRAWRRSGVQRPCAHARRNSARRSSGFRMKAEAIDRVTQASRRPRARMAAPFSSSDAVITSRSAATSFAEAISRRFGGRAPQSDDLIEVARRCGKARIDAGDGPPIRLVLAHLGAVAGMLGKFAQRRADGGQRRAQR